MFTNKKKSKVMSCSKLDNKLLNINIKRKPIEKAQSYRYLSNKIKEDITIKLD